MSDKIGDLLDSSHDGISDDDFIFSVRKINDGDGNRNNWGEREFFVNWIEQKKKVEKLESLAVKFFRLGQRLGMSSDISSVVGNFSRELIWVAKRQTGLPFELDTARDIALQLEEDRRKVDLDLDLSLNILVLGKSGVGKSCTINSIFGEEKARVDAFEPATASVKEIIGVIDGVKIRVFDTPGLKSSVLEQSFNRCILDSVKKHMKKYPVDIVLYVDRVDALTRSFDDKYLLDTITRSLGSSIWRRVILTLTHASSVPPEGQSTSSFDYDVFVAQQSVHLEEHIGQAAGYRPMVDPVLDLPVCLVENHLSCPKNSHGQKVLPNGKSWTSLLMILCYSMKIISEANSLSKPPHPSAPRKLFGFLIRRLHSLLHPKPFTGKGYDNGEWRGDLALGFNTTLAQISICRSSKVAVQARINNISSAHISLLTSSCKYLALASILPEATSIYKKLNPGVGEKSSGYVYGFWLDNLTPTSDKWLSRRVPNVQTVISSPYCYQLRKTLASYRCGVMIENRVKLLLIEMVISQNLRQVTGDFFEFLFTGLI
ncbi:hypothetical protein POM88_054437 [Heracleum sosnowskyi]|uniref:AIG1-type G domain-containing protein n=1 Tax=Heracleum sosnowskyi TaxID=360622 RepID=A0AAD8GMS9_9APIA|nr:hypothetical protein POM88_054437 [Heracleum sosnowskyi]